MHGHAKIASSVHLSNFLEQMNNFHYHNYGDGGRGPLNLPRRQTERTHNYGDGGRGPLNLPRRQTERFHNYGDGGRGPLNQPRRQTERIHMVGEGTGPPNQIFIRMVVGNRSSQSAPQANRAYSYGSRGTGPPNQPHRQTEHIHMVVGEEVLPISPTGKQSIFIW